MMTEPVITVRVVAIHYEGENVLSFRLRALDGSRLPDFEPGSHVDVFLPGGLTRSYSLSNGDAAEGYRLTVAKDRASKGGSVYMHDHIRVGQTLEIGHPRNNFKLEHDVPLTVMIAGGIGVTPFVSMIERLNASGAAWRLHYCVRTRSRAALLEELGGLGAAANGELVTYFDEEPAGGALSVSQVLSSLPADAHVYCCGPGGMLDAFRTNAKALGIADQRVHFEYFNADVALAVEGGFSLKLLKSGLDLLVPKGKTILDVVTEAGIDVPYSCQEGVCGACETKVVQGRPDHRDMILSDVEREESKTMMICCSGSKTPELVLDL